jgi:hypothetical protein
VLCASYQASFRRLLDETERCLVILDRNQAARGQTEAASLAAELARHAPSR